MTEDIQPNLAGIPLPVVEAFELEADSVEPIEIGHINRSFGVRRQAGGDCVLQRVNAIFPPAVNDDIDAVTRHLAGKGLETPLLVPTRDGARCFETAGEVWRLLTRIEGDTPEQVADDAMAHEAGRVLGAFHAALADFDAPLAAARRGVHDLKRHLAHLEATLAAESSHPARADVAALAERIEGTTASAEFGKIVPGTNSSVTDSSSLVHGDPKISNVIFRGGRGVCLVDLDTIARFPVVLELGDALRSWCNTAAEDSPAADFSASRFAAAVGAYRDAAPGFLSDDEWLKVPGATLVIAAELAARFAADAIEESYFAWDARRYPSASAHNLARARAQLALAERIGVQLDSLRGIVVTQA